MEACANSSNENDNHLINIMGGSELNLDTSMLPGDPRDLMDYVTVTEQAEDEDSLSRTFRSHFPSEPNGHSTLSGLQSPSPFNNGHLSNSPPISALTCSVSLSSSLIRSSSPSPGTSSIHSPLNSQTLHTLTPHHRLLQPLPMLQIGLTSPSQDSTHSNQDLASPPADVMDNSGNPSGSNHSSSMQQLLPIPMHTPPLQEFQSYYPSPQNPIATTIQRNSPGNGFLSTTTYSSYIPSGHTQPIPSSTLSPIQSQQQQQQQQQFPKKDRVRGVYILNNLKREPDEEYHLIDNGKRLLTTMESINTDQPPYVSFANMNINNERLHGMNLRGQRNPSGDGGISHSPLVSPMRPPSCNETSPNEIQLTPRAQHQPNYGLASPPADIGLDMVYNNGRTNVVSIHMQQHQPQQQQQQQHLFQPIHLHNTSHISPQNNPYSSQELSLTLNGPLSLNHNNSFDDSINNDPLSNATRNLSFNYGDIPGQSDLNILPSNFSNDQFSIKNTVKNNPRRSAGAVYNRRKEIEEDIADHYSSESSNNSESDEDPLYIDTGSTRNEGFECGECKQVCRTRGGLRKHLATEHLVNEPEPADLLFKEYSCPLSTCSYVTTQRDEHDSHLSEHIKDGWTPTGKKRHNKNPLQRHRYNKEEFQCPHCDYNCTVEKAFNKHLLGHENGRNDLEFTENFSCQICGRDRPSEASLRAHMDRHRKGKFYKCDICKFRSVQLKKLIQHRRMHTGEKPHLCPYCVYRAARRDNLRSHVRRMHKKNNMFCDTFTPRQMIVASAQLGANQGGMTLQRQHQQQQQQQQQQEHQQQQHQHQQQRSLMTLQQHSSAIPIPLMERLQHHHQMPQGLTGLGQQGLGLGAMSPQDLDLNSTDPLQLPQGGILLLPQGPQHSILHSPQAQ